MSAGGCEEERQWAADKRDFVADSRDAVADRRDGVADERDQVADARERLADEREVSADAREAAADAREAALDQREQRLESVGDPGAGVDRTTAGERAADGVIRSRAGDERGVAARARAMAAEERDDATVERDAATLRRLTVNRPTLLAVAFARIAQYLYDAPTYDEVLVRIAETAVATITGAGAASVTSHDQGGYRTIGSTAEAATAVDQAQYDADEGPCLDAFDAAQVEAPAFPDARWPVLGGRPTEHGVESSVSYQLAGSGVDGAETALGSLNVYAPIPAAFDQEALEIGSILAAHASLAARALGKQATLDALAKNLQQALLSRDVIGQAKGILMERLKSTPEEAFEILRRSSQQLNVKLREVARRMTETGEIDPRDLERS